MMDRPKRATRPPQQYMTSESLILAVRDRPALWDDNIPEYRDRDLKKKLWQEIAKLFVGGSPLDCSKAWKTLRRSLSNHRLQYFKKHGCSGSAAKDYVPYKHEHLMKFLDSCKGKDNMKGNLSLKRDDDDDESDDGDGGGRADGDDKIAEEEEEKEEEEENDNGVNNNQEHDGSYLSFTEEERFDQYVNKTQEPNGGKDLDDFVPGSQESGITRLMWTVDKNRKPLMDVSNSSIYSKPTGRKLFSPKFNFGIQNNLSSNGNLMNTNFMFDSKNAIKTPRKPTAAKRNTSTLGALGNSKKSKTCTAKTIVIKKDGTKKLDPEVLKVKKQKLKDAKREDIVRQLEEQVEREEAAIEKETSQKHYALSPLEEAVLRELEKKDDEVTLFLSSLQDPLRILPKPKFRKFQCQVLNILGTLEEVKVKVGDHAKKSHFELSPDMLTEVKAALSRDDDEQCVVVGQEYALYGRDLRTLDGVEWLNDQIMNAYFHLVAAKGNGKHMDSYHFQSLCKGRYSPAQWDSSDLMNCPYMVVPIYREENLHWAMMYACPQTRKLSYLDSMGGQHEEGLKTLKKFLEDKSGLEWEIQENNEHPKQMNSTDCGVFACMFANFSAAGKLDSTSFKQADIPHIRKRMLYELCHAKLLPLP